MNMKRQLLVLAATVAISAGSAFSAQTQTPAEGRKEARAFHHHKGRLAAALNLTDAQKEQMKSIREKHKAANVGLRTELKQIQQQLRAARQAKNTAEAQRLAALREPLVARAHEAWQTQREEMKSVLTPEQQTKAEELRKNFQNKRQRRG